MSQRMLIDARHPEETRVAVVNGSRIEEFDFEAAERKQLKGNIYLAKVTRVEPSLQAAFVEYGGNRHGFLAFAEIHPDYYQIPREDREALLAEEAELVDEPHDEPEGDEGDEIAVTGGVDDAGSDVLRRQRQALRRRYKIQEVIRRRQVLLIQVVKEERGNKGAALTTYLSLAGRFCVLMPNTAHGGGISRKISNLGDRKRLKSIMADLQLPVGMGAIVRTAGLKRTRAEIKRDFDYLTRLWDEIRDTTLSSVAPCLVHQDSDLIKRAIRDIYSREIDQVLVDGEDGFAAAQTFMQLLMPKHAPKVVHYADPVPLFQRFGVEAALAGMYHPVVQLKSGGYIVINPTEALVSIDVNSGRSTRELGIEETAYKTNLEAADEIGRQLRLRDMAGLVVIDFIDMEVGGNNRRVERAMKEAMKTDRARIQIGRISSFGLMELSRQRLRTGVLEASTHVCPMCDGSGYVRSISSAALAALRALEAEAIKGRATEFSLRAGLDVAMYILNRKRAEIVELEDRYTIAIETIPDESLMGPNFVLEAGGPAPEHPVPMSVLPPPVRIDDDDEIESAAEADDDAFDDEDEGVERAPRGEGEDDAEGERPARTAHEPRGDDERGDGRGEAKAERGGRRRRRRRGGGRDRVREGDEPIIDIASNADILVTGTDADDVVAGETAPVIVADDIDALNGDGVVPLTSSEAEGEGGKRRRRRGGRGRRREGGEAGIASEAAPVEGETPDLGEATAVVAPELDFAPDDVPVAVEAEPVKKPRRSRAKKATDAPVDLPEAPVADETPAAPVKPKRSRRKVADAVIPDAEASVTSPAEPAIVAEPDAFVDTAEIAPATEPAHPANDASDAPEAPRKGGWWQRTFGN